ncbi:MAG: hypothetical protein ACFFB5_19810 [Promethearchaeota archaeon]
MTFQMDAFEELMTNPTKTAIWAEIFRKPGITAKELTEILNFKKTKTYYTLKAMLNSGLIEAEIITVKESFSLKKYRISKGFEEFLKNKEFPKEKPREAQLFQLLIIQSLINIEIRKILNSTNEELKEKKEKILKKNRLPTGIGVILYAMEREQKLLNDFNEFLETKIDLKDTIDPDTYEKMYGSFFFGFVGSE